MTSCPAMLVTIFLGAMLVLTSFVVVLVTTHFTLIVLIRLLRVVLARIRCMLRVRVASPLVPELALRTLLVMLAMTSLTDQT